MVMKSDVMFVELPVFNGVIPLASGYMEAYCRKDQNLVDAYRFRKVSHAVTTPYADILRTLVDADAGVYAFSCYVWNTGLVRRLLAAAVQKRPDATFVLGGPQVMHQGAEYLNPANANVLVCNGEGERTFADILRQKLKGSPNWAEVQGISAYIDGELITTSPQPRIADLSEVPSPFLEGLFEQGKYTWTLLETNRGCPFACNYCYWGAATASRVHKYAMERVEGELEWISKSGAIYLFIADANWGMLPRDVDLSRRLVEYQKRNGSPLSVYFCGSKNTPERVAEITRIFSEAGILSCQSVALQTLNDETLRRVRRQNIKSSAYMQLQRALNEQKLPSFVEMIWPLPGETLETFERGVSELCAVDADGFVFYPLLLMHNVELRERASEYGLVTITDPNPDSEAELVIGTSEVDARAYEAGIRYIYAATSLYTLRGLFYTCKYLHKRRGISYSEVFKGFLAFAGRNPHHPWTKFCDRGIATAQQAAFSNTGALVHLVLHAERKSVDNLLHAFVRSQDFWNDPLARLCWEIDLLNRPHVYRNTSLSVAPGMLESIRVADSSAGHYSIELPTPLMSELAEAIELPAPGVEEWAAASVHYRGGQLPFMPAKPLAEHYMYCQDMSHRTRSMLPSWTCERRLPQRATVA